jgi:hypothetical protein
MDGGTTYHFVTDGIHAALKLATEAANGKDIRLAGGVATIRQYLQAGLIDQLHIPISPIILGTGESLFSGIDMLKLGYVVTEMSRLQGPPILFWRNANRPSRQAGPRRSFLENDMKSSFKAKVKCGQLGLKYIGTGRGFETAIENIGLLAGGKLGRNAA